MQLFNTVTWPLAGWRTVACEAQAIIHGHDLTGASFFAEVRDRRDGGAVRATLNTVTSASAQGIRLASVDNSAGYPISTIALRINETTMEAIPPAISLGVEPGDNLDLEWGMHLTPSGGLKFMAFNGPFVVYPGVPQ